MPARMWLAAAAVVVLLGVAAAWSAMSSQLGGPVSAREAGAVPQPAVATPEVAARSTAGSEARSGQAAPAAAPVVKPAEAPSQEASKAIETPATEAPAAEAAPDSATKPTAKEQDLRGGLHIGGHARLMDSFIGVVDVDESDVAKTINVHILQDEDFNYFFDLDSQTVPAGEKVMFVVNNTHFTPDECW